MTEKVTLRPVAADDLGKLLKLLEGAAGEYQWFGFRGERIKELLRRFEADGLLGPDESFLAVGLEEHTCAGWVNWRPVGPFANYEIGIALFAEHRGRGIGTGAGRATAFCEGVDGPNLIAAPPSIRPSPQPGSAHRPGGPGPIESTVRITHASLILP